MNPISNLSLHVYCPYCESKSGEWCKTWRGFLRPHVHPERNKAALKQSEKPNIKVPYV